MQAASFDEGLEQILKKDGRYHRNAYVFIREALEFTQKVLGKEGRSSKQHVSPEELLCGIRDYALQVYGPMVLAVFEEWNVHSGRDFGEIVFTMVEHNLLAKTDQDSRTDFENGYDFESAFRDPYLPEAKRAKKPAPAKAARI